MSHLCRKEDAVYMKFVHDITEDVLARGIYSDRGLRQLFQRHMADNEGQLNLVSVGSRALWMVVAVALSNTVLRSVFIPGPDARRGGPIMWAAWHPTGWQEWLWKWALAAGLEQEDITLQDPVRGQGCGTGKNFQFRGIWVYAEGKEHSMSDTAGLHGWWKLCRCGRWVWGTRAHTKCRATIRNQLSNIWDTCDWLKHWPRHTTGWRDE